MGCSSFRSVSPSLQVDCRAEENPSASVDVNLFASAVLSGGDSVMVGDRGKVFLSEGWGRNLEGDRERNDESSGDRLLPG